jgi:gluconate 2-dehydrogenase alpha chain
MSRTVGGTAVHADMKYPRFNEVDFRLASVLGEAGLTFDGTSFADWPLTYDELEPFYAEAEILTGVAGSAGADPFASRRSSPYPMPPSTPMYVGLALSEGARRAGWHPFSYPAAINSEPYPDAPELRRPACVSCGFCSGYGCPNNSKCSPAVTTLRRALLTGNCQLRYNCFVRRLRSDGSGRRIIAAEYVDPDGAVQEARGDHFILAAVAMESVRLALLSDLSLGNGPAFHLGAHMLFHYQTTGVGIFRQRLHGERGQAVTNGMSDFRGVAEGGAVLHPDGRPLGGIVEFGTSSEPIVSGKSARESLVLARVLQSPITLKRLLVESPFHAHLGVLIMQAEDAPQPGNRVDLDPDVRDVYGLPVVRLTYQNHRFELEAAEYYKPHLVEILRRAGAQIGFIDPTGGGIPRSRHVMGGLRMGRDPADSVCDPFGRFHDLENLYCMDGGVFVTGSGYNPTLTIIALALRSAAHLAEPASPERLLGARR